ncbi:MAG: protein kinase [Planctomyces sp.]
MSPTQTGEFDLQQTLQQADGWRLMLAVHRPTGRTVHLLIFSQELSQLPQFRAALKTDRDTLLQLRHACIQRFLGFAESDGELLCWMEPPEAPSLATVMASGTQLSIDEIIDIGWQLSSALQQLHNLGLAHGALSADTVLLSEGLHPTITSLGMHRWLAAATAAKASLVQPGTGPAIISVSAFASQDQVLTDLRDVALLLKRLLELSRDDQTRKIPAAAGTASARPRLARLLERLIGTDQSTALTARELQGRMGELLLEGGEMPINDQRDEAAGRRNSIVLNLFDDATEPDAATPRQTPADPAGRLPKLPIVVAVVVVLLLTLVAALLR